MWNIPCAAFYITENVVVALQIIDGSRNSYIEIEFARDT